MPSVLSVNGDVIRQREEDSPNSRELRAALDAQSPEERTARRLKSTAYVLISVAVFFHTAPRDTISQAKAGVVDYID